MGAPLGSRTLVRQLKRVVSAAQNGLEVVRMGGLETDIRPSEFHVVDRERMYRLRRYFPADIPQGPPIILVPPMMISANVYDIAGDQGAAAMLHAAGIDVWVVDFGEPDVEEGGWDRSLADHLIALSSIIDKVVAATGRSVYLGGYSQGGMFCYQAAAYRASAGIAGIVTYGSPVDTLAAPPFGVPTGLAIKGGELLADHVFNRLGIPGWLARTGFQMLDPMKTVKSRLDFLRQLHDRDALLPREPQRRFLSVDGWVGYSGPALVELLKQFVVHNRMMTGGFTIGDRPVALAELTMPILAFLGSIDDIGQPLAVRGILRAAPRSAVYECEIDTGHFGLVVGSKATQISWPTTIDWIHWTEGEGAQPPSVIPMDPDSTDEPTFASLVARIVHTTGAVAEVGVDAGRAVTDLVSDAIRGTREVSSEAIRTLPRILRLGQIQPHTQISFGRVLAEQAERTPWGDCFLFDGRVHTYSAVDERIDKVVRGLIANGVRPAMRVGVLMETRPSALASVVALSRIGAVAVMLRTGPDIGREVELSEVSIIVTDPENLAEAVSVGDRVLVLGGGDQRILAEFAHPAVVDLEHIDPDTIRLPDWYRPDPGMARDLAFVLFSGSGSRIRAKHISNSRWALSAIGTAGAARLGPSDTVYCLAPLSHSSGLLVGVGSAVAGGARIALSREVDPDRFADEVLRYGVTVVSYTWTMVRTLLDSPLQPGRHPIRLFIGSGMPVGLWLRTLSTFAPAKVLEFYATSEGTIALANTSGSKIGSKGRPLPGSGRVELVAYDACTDAMLEGDDGLLRHATVNEPGILLGEPEFEAGQGPDVMRGVFRRGDVWSATTAIFRRDADGDFWLLGDRRAVIRTGRGPVFPQPIVDALGTVEGVDLATVYAVGKPGRQLAVCALTMLPRVALSSARIGEALGDLLPAERPDIVHVVPDIQVGTSYRTTPDRLRAAGLPAPTTRTWYFDAESGSYRRLTRAIIAERFGDF